MARKTVDDFDPDASWPSGFAEAAQAIGRERLNNPGSMLIQRSAQPDPQLRDQIVSALMGMRQSFADSNAAAAQFADPVVSSLAAIAGAAGQPGPQAIAAQRQDLMRQRQLAALEAAPVESISPAIVEAHPELAGMPFKYINQISGLLERDQAARDSAAREQLTPQELKLLAKQTGMSEADLKGIRKSVIGSMSLVPKALGAEAAVKVGLARDGIANIADIRKALESPRARELIVKAGGSWNKLSTLGDPEAEALANAIEQAADAEARIKTGAAINEQEVERYFNRLVPKTGSMDGIKDRLTRKERYFQAQEALLSEGRNVADTRSGGGSGMDMAGLQAAAQAELARRNKGAKK